MTSRRNFVTSDLVSAGHFEQDRHTGDYKIPDELEGIIMAFDLKYAQMNKLKRNEKIVFKDIQFRNINAFHRGIHTIIGLLREEGDEMSWIKMEMFEDDSEYDEKNGSFIYNLESLAYAVGAECVCWDMASPIIRNHAAIITAILNENFYFIENGSVLRVDYMGPSR